MTPPNEVSGTGGEARWFNALRRFIISCRLLPGIGYRLDVQPSGTKLLIEPSMGGGSSIGEYRLKSVQGDYITVRSWSGGIEGTEDILVAKPYKLRQSLTSETLIGGSVNTYAYSAGTDANNVKRTHTELSTVQDEYVAPPWIVNEIIYAVAGTSSVANATHIYVGSHRQWAAYVPTGF